MKTCPKCHYPNPDEHAYCSKCGHALAPDLKSAGKRIWVIALIVFASVLISARFVYVLMFPVIEVNPAYGNHSESTSITYEVTGTAPGVSVTYNTPDGTSQESNMAIPWRRSFDFNSGDFVYLSAQNTGDYGSVTVSIKQDGIELKQSTSAGAYVIASANGRL